MIVKFEVPGNPVGKQRVRFTKIKGFVRTYTPDKTRVYEDKVRKYYEQSCYGKTLAGPLEMFIDAYFDVPKSASKKKQKALLGTPYDKKPDVDNVAKSVMDALNDVGYVDDRAVARLHVSETYDKNPRAEITIRQIIPTATRPIYYNTDIEPRI